MEEGRRWGAAGALVVVQTALSVLSRTRIVGPLIAYFVPSVCLQAVFDASLPAAYGLGCALKDTVRGMKRSTCLGTLRCQHDSGGCTPLWIGVEFAKSIVALITACLMGWWRVMRAFVEGVRAPPHRRKFTPRWGPTLCIYAGTVAWIVSRVWRWGDTLSWPFPFPSLSPLPFTTAGFGPFRLAAAHD